MKKVQNVHAKKRERLNLPMDFDEAVADSLEVSPQEAQREEKLQQIVGRVFGFSSDESMQMITNGFVAFYQFS